MRTFAAKNRSPEWRPFGLQSKDRPLDTITRTVMESRFGHDFSRVAVHADRPAAEAADRFSAVAFARGNQIYFGESNYDPSTPAGRDLLEHELGHVVEQDAAGVEMVQRKPAPGATVQLGGKKHTVAAGDTLWKIADTFYGNGALWPKIAAANPKKVRAGNVIITGDELDVPLIDADTLDTFKAFQNRPQELLDTSRAMSDADYQAFYTNLPQKEKEANAQLLQTVEITRSSGMTPDQLAEAQKKFLEAEAAKKKVSVGEHVKDVIKTTGYGSSSTEKWEALSDEQKNAYQADFFRLTGEIEKSGPDDIKEVIATAKKNGGGFEWTPLEMEKNAAFAYTRNDWKLYGGRLFVDALRDRKERVYGTILHEMGGHNYYGGRKTGLEIQKGALDKLPPEEKTKALSGGNSLSSAYGYMETEIFAELYEFKYDTAKYSDADHPFAEDASGKPNPKSGDVRRQLIKIMNAFEPTVAEAIVRGLARRVDIDPRITPKAKELFKGQVFGVFGIRL